jgi:hypothetical protein
MQHYSNRFLFERGAVTLAHPHRSFSEARMPTTLPRTDLVTLSTISPDLDVVCLFSLFGLTFSAAVLSNVSSEMISVMFSSIG